MTTREILLVAATIAGMAVGVFVPGMCRWLWKWFRKLTHEDPNPQTLKYVVHIYGIGFTVSKVRDGDGPMRERCDFYEQPYIEPPPIPCEHGHSSCPICNPWT